jgi:hypothetical protein
MLLVMLGSLLITTSCSKSDDGDGGGAAASGILTANVDGTSYQSMEISSSATIAITGSVKNLVIIASNSDGNAFAFTILGYDGTGTYPIGGGANIFNTASYTETNVNLSNPTASTTEIWQAPFDDVETGTITISEETENKVIGSFNFKCKNVGGNNSIKNMTKGLFNLNKQTT